MHVWPPRCRVSFVNFQTRPEARDRAYLISPGLSEYAKSVRVNTVSEGLKTHVAVTGSVVTKPGPNALNCGAETRGFVYGQRTPHPAMVVQRTWEVIMLNFSPELIRNMRAALDEVMTQIPLEQATPGVKAALAEYVLKAAAQGQTSYEDLIAAASGQIQTVLSMLS